ERSSVNNLEITSGACPRRIASCESIREVTSEYWESDGRGNRNARQTSDMASPRGYDLIPRLHATSKILNI
ncbi:MAG: hypothetical protein AB2809_12860, partial [Candidatus Thiodiazotropha sp.]